MLIELSILVLLVVFVLTILIGLQYFGLFSEILVNTGTPPYQFGGRIIAYKKQKGSYSQASTLFTEACSLLPTLPSIGVYFDDPDLQQNVNNCRFIVGLLLDSNDCDYNQHKQLLISKGFLFGQLPIVDHVVYTVFPFRGVISVVIAIRRVYPKIKSYIAEHNLCAHPAIEVYSNDQIFFMFPLAKQDQFYQLYGSVDNEDSEDNSGDEEDDDDEVVNAQEDNDNNEKIVAEQVPNPRLRGSKGSKHSSTSSSFEELIADDNGK